MMWVVLCSYFSLKKKAELEKWSNYFRKVDVEKLANNIIFLNILFLQNICFCRNRYHKKLMFLVVLKKLMKNM